MKSRHTRILWLSALAMLTASKSIGAADQPSASMPDDLWSPPGGPLIDLSASKPARKTVVTEKKNPETFSTKAKKVEEPVTSKAANTETKPASAGEKEKSTIPVSSPFANYFGGETQAVSAKAASAPDPKPKTKEKPKEPEKPKPEIKAPKKKVATREVLSEPLPGVSHLPGQKALPPPVVSPRPLVMDITSGITEVVTVSATMPNRVATPFTKPIAVDSSGAEIDYVGNNVFILPASEAPFGIFISDENGGPVAALTMVPKAIPSQNIVLEIERTGRLNAGDALAPEQDRTPDHHTDRVVHILRSAVVDRVPNGFTQAKIDVGKAVIGPTLLIPDKRWTGGDLDIYRYVVKNTSSETIELTEPTFYEEGVKAVAFFPKVRLRPSETSHVFIVRGGRLAMGRSQQFSVKR